ncbi:alkaline phosphatase [candidate division KSB1 bacterium]|nr:alkaline phosphatase [candidate division KSB1 bacterium]
MNRLILHLGAIFILIQTGLGFTQSTDSTADSLKTYLNERFYDPVDVDVQKLVQQKRVKNIILFIGDGMGVTHVFSGLTANKGKLNLLNLKTIGFSKTQPATRYVTDSAAGGTALSTGVKTYNGAIAVDVDSLPVKTILELAEKEGLATGLVATSSITHATPASFIAHQKSRSLDFEIAKDFMNTDIDVFIGGGQRFFDKREDGFNLIHDLENKGYQVLSDLDAAFDVETGPLAVFTAEESNLRASKRNGMLPKATELAIKILSQNEKGFFLMVEGSQIDWGAHGSNTGYVIEDMLDLDLCIGKALEFAVKEGETLIILTADHETGGMAVEDGSMQTGYVKADYTTGGHTGVMVPVFAAGPKAELFMGIYENTAIFYKIKKALGIN